MYSQSGRDSQPSTSRSSITSILSLQGKFYYRLRARLAHSGNSDSGFYCLECPKLFAKTSTPKRPALEGPSFDGSYGIDTEDLVSIPSIDFGSLYVMTLLAGLHEALNSYPYRQIAPEQIQLFPVLKHVKPATQAIGDGGKWIEVHSQTSIL